MCIRGRRIVVCLCAFMILVAGGMGWPCAVSGAQAQQELSTATDTPKPWLRPLPEQTSTDATALSASLEAVSEALPASPAEAADPQGYTLPPSSLQEVEGVAMTLSPTVTPTLTPTPEPPLELPAVLGLTDAQRLRVLLIGTDAYRPEDSGRSDAMLLLQIDLRTGELKMVSFLRDLYVRIPGHGSIRLNAAYVYGGAALLAQTLWNHFGLSTDRYLAVNFSLMVSAIDHLGGITVEVSEQERKQINSILKYYNKQIGIKEKDGLLEEAGMQLLTGKQALCFSRIRKMDSDFQRSNRQKKVIEAIYARIREMDALALASLASEMFHQIKTDMTLSDIIGLVPVLMRMEEVQFDSLTIPASGTYHNDTIRGSDVLVADFELNTARINAFLE